MAASPEQPDTPKQQHQQQQQQPQQTQAQPSQLQSNEELQQSVKVAVNVRPLVGQEISGACQECVVVHPYEPQVKVLPDKLYTFDHVYGGLGSSSSGLYRECVLPLVEGLFNGYNATVLAYGQTGSGKTYSMGTAYTPGGKTQGIIPQSMQTIFEKAESLKNTSEFQIRVSFIEIIKEEIRDLLDPGNQAAANPSGFTFGATKQNVPGKPAITIRETNGGGIILNGVSEVYVTSLKEMANCLEQGSLARSTGSTNMNASSSRSHAIFTITLEQKKKSQFGDESSEEFLSAKLHLVDLAGSERIKKTKADGDRMQEGIKINKGLLSLGNVISALGDDKKRKEATHIPYRDSKLTRLLQDSLGGNSRTVMIACVSPADINMDETINTLKYANRARNIQNKPTVNRDTNGIEIQRLRNKIELLEAENSCLRAAKDNSENERKNAILIRMNSELKEKNSQLKSNLFAQSNAIQEIKVEGNSLHECILTQSLENLKIDDIIKQIEPLKAKMSKLVHLCDKVSTLVDVNSSNPSLTNNSPLIVDRKNSLSPLKRKLSSISGELDIGVSMDEGVEVDEHENSNDMAIEFEVEAKAVAEAEEEAHSIRQECINIEIVELNKKLQEKEAEMQNVIKDDKSSQLRLVYEKKIHEIEEERKKLQKEKDTLTVQVESIRSKTDAHNQKLKENFRSKIEYLEKQLEAMKIKHQETMSELKLKQKMEGRAKHLQEEILKLKQQKVALQKKKKMESDEHHARMLETEKQILQLKKNERRNVFTMHKLEADIQKQKMVLQRKNEEAALATKKLNDLLTARARKKKNASNSETMSAFSETELKSWLEDELELEVEINGVRKLVESEHKRRMELSKQLEELKSLKNEGLRSSGESSPLKIFLKSPRARSAKEASLHSSITRISQNILTMQNQIAEAEERKRCTLRWTKIKNITDAHVMIDLAFNSAVSSRSAIHVLRKEMKSKILELESENFQITKKLDKLRRDEKKRESLSEYFLQKKDINECDWEMGMKISLEDSNSPPKVKVQDQDINEEADVLEITNEEIERKAMKSLDTIQETLPRFNHRKDSTISKVHPRKMDRVSMEANDIKPSRRKIPSKSISKNDSDANSDDTAEKHNDIAEDDIEFNEDAIHDPDYIPGFKDRGPSSKFKKRLNSQQNTTPVVPNEESNGILSQPAIHPHFPRPPSKRVHTTNGEPEQQINIEGEKLGAEVYAGCACGGKCVKNCECRLSGRICDVVCQCKSSKCSNRALEDVDPSAEATSAVMELSDAMNVLLNQNQSVGQPSDNLDRVEFAKEIMFVHGAEIQQAMERGLRVPLQSIDRNDQTGTRNRRSTKERNASLQSRRRKNGKSQNLLPPKASPPEEDTLFSSEPWNQNPHQDKTADDVDGSALRSFPNSSEPRESFNDSSTTSTPHPPTPHPSTIPSFLASNSRSFLPLASNDVKTASVRTSPAEERSGISGIGINLPRSGKNLYALQSRDANAAESQHPPKSANPFSSVTKMMAMDSINLNNYSGLPSSIGPALERTSPKYYGSENAPTSTASGTATAINSISSNNNGSSSVPGRRKKGPSSTS